MVGFGSNVCSMVMYACAFVYSYLLKLFWSLVEEENDHFLPAATRGELTAAPCA